MIQASKQIADLNWQRLAPWQELTAQAFDQPDRRSAVWEIDGITIDYERGNSTQALMFLGWIASRLEWEPIERITEGGDYEAVCEWKLVAELKTIVFIKYHLCQIKVLIRFLGNNCSAGDVKLSMKKVLCSYRKY